jgi:hypothetical protein
MKNTIPSLDKILYYFSGTREEFVKVQQKLLIFKFECMKRAWVRALLANEVKMAIKLKNDFFEQGGRMKQWQKGLLETAERFYFLRKLLVVYKSFRIFFLTFKGFFALIKREKCITNRHMDPHIGA